MCKSDILKAFGYHVSVNSRRRAQFSSQNGGEDGDERRVNSGRHRHPDHNYLSDADANSTTSESNAFPFPVVSEIHDPFSFTPSSCSPPIQVCLSITSLILFFDAFQVMHATNARSFSIVPLTVHSACPPTSISTQTNCGADAAAIGYGNPTLVSATVEKHNCNNNNTNNTGLQKVPRGERKI